MSDTDPLLKNLPPHSKEAERAVLGAVLVDAPSCLDDLVLGGLGAEDFYSAQHQAVWRSVTEMHRSDLPIDVTLLNDWLTVKGTLEAVGGTAALADLTEAVPNAANANYYADIVRRKSDLRRLITATALVQRWAYSASAGAVEVRPADVQRKADEIVRSVLPDRTPVASFVGEVVGEVIERALRGEVPVVWPTGFRDVDERLGGGVGPGTLTLIAARPSVGKTAFASRVAVNMARAGIGVTFFSLEVPKAQFAQNVLSAEVGLPGRTIAANAITQREWDDVNRAREFFRGLPLQIRDGRWSLGDLLTAARYDVRKRGVSVVLVDYLQLVDVDEAGRSREEEVSETSREFKVLAMESGIAMVALAQLSRKVEDRKDKWPSKSDLRGSGSLEQDADNILLLHRPEVYEPGKEGLRGVAHVIFEKQRNGPPGMEGLHFDGPTMRFEDVRREEPWERRAREEREALASSAEADA